MRKKFKKQTELFKKGKNRVIEKTKEIRQLFSKAVVSSSRSGSGKIVFEHYDTLVKIWGGSATSQPLPFGISSFTNMLADIETMNDDSCSTSDDNESKITEDYDENQPKKSLHVINNGNDGSCDKTDNLPQKRKSVTGNDNGNVVPKLIDNKRKHLEKTLSAAQRDQLMMKDMKGDAEFRQSLVQVMRESNETFSKSIKEISKSMSDLSKGLCSSMELLAKSLGSQNFPPQHLPQQNIYYHQYQQQSPNPQVDNGLSRSQETSFYSQYLNDGEQF